MPVLSWLLDIVGPVISGLDGWFETEDRPPFGEWVTYDSRRVTFEGLGVYYVQLKSDPEPDPEPVNAGAYD